MGGVRGRVGEVEMDLEMDLDLGVEVEAVVEFEFQLGNRLVQKRGHHAFSVE